MRTRKIVYNSVTSLLLQFVTAVCGFVLPRFLISAFGSEINGAIASITQFLGYISLIESGVGGVTRAALYKPLAEKDNKRISGIFNATEKFFRGIAYVFIAYTVVLSVGFKYISNTELDWLFTALLVLVLSVSTFSQYYFGITYSVLFQADQKNYIGNVIQIVSVILNTVLSVMLIQLGCNILIIKAVSVMTYLIRPFFLRAIAKRTYQIDKRVVPDTAAIQQRWNGFGHHIAYYIHNNVDVMVITIFLGLKYSSVYSVYGMILMGIKSIVISLSGGSEAAFGDMIAKNETENLRRKFGLVETLSSMVVTVFFTVAGLLIFDFISIYTSGVRDIEYIIVPFGILFAISEALHCIKQNYHGLVLAAGHYKQTQRGAFVEAGINIVCSIVLSFAFGLSGIVLATVLSTCYRTLDYIFYLRKNIIFREIRVFVKRMAVNCLSVISVIVVCIGVGFDIATDYFSWTAKAVAVFAIAFTLTTSWNMLFYSAELKGIVRQFFRPKKTK